MRIEKDFKEFIRLLNEKKVKYLIVGGFAFSFYAIPRYTKNLDVFIERSKENIKKLMNVLKEFGFGNIGLKEEDFLNENNIIQLGYEPVRIDILVSIEGISFSEAWEHKNIDHYGDEECFYISIDDLIKNKESTGRLMDKADAEVLRKIKNKKR